MRLPSATIWLTTLALGALGSACNSSSDSGGSTGQLNSGVEKSKLGEDVTDQEAQSVCEASTAYAQSQLDSASFQKATCRYTGILTAALLVSQDTTDTDLRDMCQLAYDSCVECLDNPNADGCQDSTVQFDVNSDCSTAQAPADCTSTVGEIEACLKADVDMGVAQFNSLPSCSELSLDSLDQLSQDNSSSDLPAACNTVQENCPEVLADDTTQ